MQQYPWGAEKPIGQAPDICSFPSRFFVLIASSVPS
jgi:hypothetical protein